MALASIILGAMGFCTFGLTSVIGLVLGIVALTVGARGGRAQGRAIAGVVISGTGLMLGPMLMALMAGLMMPALAQAQMKARFAREAAYLRQLGEAMHAYANDHQDQFPPAATWHEALVESAAAGSSGATAEPIVASPLYPDRGRAWAMNAALDGVALDRVRDPAGTVLLFEIAPGGPMAGGPELLPAEPRLRRGHLIYFVDGHASMVGPEEIDQLVWEP